MDAHLRQTRARRAVFPARVAEVLFLLGLALATARVTVRADAPEPQPAQALKQMSLEDLGNIEITSVSKGPETLHRTPAAVYVITRDDIRRSGKTTLPEILRLAPGVDVARIDTTHWSVGIRGFGDQFSKSLLVLIDGRSVYTPLFAGVFWATADTLIDDIDRIEIIRGPGGTIWGTNAVTGVVNIVTTSTEKTHGLLASATSGTIDQGIANVRYGGAARAIDYRVYGKAFRRAPEAHTDGATFDRWRMGQGGGRLDWSHDADSITIEGDAFDGRVGQSVELGEYAPPAEVLHVEPFLVSGGNVVAGWRRTRGEGHGIEVRAYVDRTSWRGPQLDETRTTVDIDAVHRWTPDGRDHVTWGAGVRKSPGTVTPTVPTLDFTPRGRTESVYSLFGQDEITLVTNRLSATMGTKIEHHSYTGVEVQPSARLLWTPSERQSVWGAVTRAVRTPSRLERDFSLTGYLGVATVPTFIRVLGNPDFDSETLIGYEMGYRGSLSAHTYLDVAAFHNQHDKLESFGAASVVVETEPAPLHAVLAVPYANGVGGTSDGIEIAPSWTPASWWTVRGSYSYLRLDLKNRAGNTDTMSVQTYEESSPRHQSLVQSMVDLGRGWSCDQTLRHVGALPVRHVAAYTEASLALAWRRDQGFSIALAGDNLLHASHAEFGHDPGPIVNIRRSVSVTATWSGR